MKNKINIYNWREDFDKRFEKYHIAEDDPTNYSRLGVQVDGVKKQVKDFISQLLLSVLEEMKLKDCSFETKPMKAERFKCSFWGGKYNQTVGYQKAVDDLTTKINQLKKKV